MLVRALHVERKHAPQAARRRLRRALERLGRTLEVARLKTHHLHFRMRIERPVEAVFAFFADARNLERITPPGIRFRILGEPPPALRAGIEIDYQLRLRAIPLRWRSRITAWQPPHRFVDEQARGPYRLWRHEHLFERDGDATLASDHVEYAAIGGPLVQRLLIAPDLERIFAYRLRALSEIFAPGSDPRPKTSSPDP
jgi:ligand-binding SRPBCC domain-containing protein